MPYVPPHLRAQSYYKDSPAPKIATSLAEAQAMSKAVTTTPTSVLSQMLSAPAPKFAGAVSQNTPQQTGGKRPNATTIAALAESRALGNLHAAKNGLISASATPVAAGSFSGMISPATPPVIKPKKSKMVADPDHKPISQQVQQAPTVTINNPAFDAAMDDILRTLFEDGMKNVKRIASANIGDFTRRVSGSYKNERLESRYQGFKMQKLEEHAGKASDTLEKILRQRFEIAMQGVKRIASAAPLNFERRTNGAYVNERLESRYQGYLMASVNDFGLSVLRKIADNRVVALKAIR
jgi:hypothetical protein